MMKHTSVLSLAAATALFCGAAQAADDVTSPLYLTSELEALSTTSLAYNRTHIKHDSAKEDFILKKRLWLVLRRKLPFWQPSATGLIPSI